VTTQTANLTKRLAQLNNDDLVLGLDLAMRAERSMTIRVLHFLNEMERRSLHLDLGYSSLFDYCIRKLKYSRAAACRRIQAARCTRRYPDIQEMLEERELSLSTISLIEPFLTNENFASVIERVRGRSHRDVEKVVAEYRPPMAYRDRVSTVRVAVPAVDADRELFKRELGRAVPGIATVEKQYIQFLADEQFMNLFEEVRSLVTRDGEPLSFAEVVTLVLIEYRERHSPSARQRRRAARKGGATPDSRRRECGTVAPQSRHIPEDVRDAIWERDQGRCSYQGPDGTQCSSRHGLQVDHEVPYSAGGTHDIGNLRLLCAAHNRRAVERQLGTRIMRRYRMHE
jgi:5-methylcytosine-specific restriction endonuclease McrA